MDRSDNGERERRWAAAYAHRERLLRIARARVGNLHDAEDCVQEALVRCVEFADLDEERLGQFLTTVTIRLCADVHRGQTRGAKLSRRLTSFLTDDPGPEESVCDRAESAWLSRRLDSLTPRQRAIVEARAEGLSCGAVAERLLLPYTTVESALSRIRRAMRGALESTLGVVSAPSWEPTAQRARRLLAGALTATTAAVAIPGFVGEPAEVQRRTVAPWSVTADSDQAAAARHQAGPSRSILGITALLSQACGAPTTGVAPDALTTPLTKPGVTLDAGGHHVDPDDESLGEIVDRCVEYGYVIGDKYGGCRYGRDDPRYEDQHETVGVPPVPDGGHE